MTAKNIVMAAAGAEAAAGPPDAQFNYVTMLLHANGTNGAQNNTFLDSSTNNFTITRNGNTTQGSFSPYGSNWSNYFNTSTPDYLSLASSANLSPQSSDFCIEAWIFPTTLNSSYATIYTGPSIADAVYFGFLIGAFGLRARGNADLVYSSTLPPVGTWTHVAATRSGTSLRLFYNGVQQGSTVTNSTNFIVGAVDIGSAQGSFSFDGYISNLRFVKGSAVYTSNFTPSTTPLTAITNTQLLTCQSNRFIDNSSNAFALTTTGTPSVQRFNPFGASTAYSTSVIGGSGYFDGTDDYLSYTQQTYSGNFTMECWVYQIASSSSYAMLFSVGGANTQLMIDYSGTGKITFYYNGTAISSASNVFIRNQWNHIAYVRSGSTITIYYNGASVASGTLSDAIPISYIGGYSSSGYTLNGYMSDVRITTSALYTTTFTPPTAPLATVSGTSVLLNMTNGAIYDNAMMNDLETVGNAQISTSVKKYGTGSLAFDGTGDYLASNASGSNVAYTFGTGDFTIELWLYLNTVSGGPFFIYDGRPLTTQGAYPCLFMDNATLTYQVNSGDLFYATLATGTWYHIAVCRSGTTNKLFVNGTQQGSATDSTNYLSGGAGRPGIGGGGYSTSNYFLNGYIDDLRITKGYARYTANFTPPTAAFSDK